MDKKVQSGRCSWPKKKGKHSSNILLLQFHNDFVSKVYDFHFSFVIKCKASPIHCFLFVTLIICYDNILNISSITADLSVSIERTHTEWKCLSFYSAFMQNKNCLAAQTLIKLKWIQAWIDPTLLFFSFFFVFRLWMSCVCVGLPNWTILSSVCDCWVNSKTVMCIHNFYHVPSE